MYMHGHTAYTQHCRTYTALCNPLNMLASLVPPGVWTPGLACQNQELICQRLVVHLVRRKQFDLGRFHAPGI